MRKARIPESALQIALLALKDAVPELTPDALKQALERNASATAGPHGTGSDRLVSAVEGSRLLGISRRTFDRLANDGHFHRIRITLPHCRRDGREIGGVVRYRLSEVERIVARGTVQ